MYSRSTRKLRTAVIGQEEEEPGQLLILTVINVACEIHSEEYPVLRWYRYYSFTPLRNKLWSVVKM